MPKSTSVSMPNVAKPATIEMPTPTVVTAVVAVPAVLVANAVPEAVPPMPLVTFESLLAVSALFIVLIVCGYLTTFIFKIPIYSSASDIAFVVLLNVFCNS